MNKLKLKENLKKLKEEKKEFQLKFKTLEKDVIDRNKDELKKFVDFLDINEIKYPKDIRVINSSGYRGVKSEMFDEDSKEQFYILKGIYENLTKIKQEWNEAKDLPFEPATVEKLETLKQELKICPHENSKKRWELTDEISEVEKTDKRQKVIDTLNKKYKDLMEAPETWEGVELWKGIWMTDILEKTFLESFVEKIGALDSDLRYTRTFEFDIRYVNRRNRCEICKCPNCTEKELELRSGVWFKTGKRLKYTNKKEKRKNDLILEFYGLSLQLRYSLFQEQLIKLFDEHHAKLYDELYALRQINLNIKEIDLKIFTLSENIRELEAYEKGKKYNVKLKTLYIKIPFLSYVEDYDLKNPIRFEEIIEHSEGQEIESEEFKGNRIIRKFKPNAKKYVLHYAGITVETKFTQHWSFNWSRRIYEYLIKELQKELNNDIE